MRAVLPIMQDIFSAMCYIFLLLKNQKLVNLICIIQIYNSASNYAEEIRERMH